MNLQVVNRFYDPTAPLPTNGGDAFQQVRDWVIRIGGVLTPPGTSTEIQSLLARDLVAEGQTNSGLVVGNIGTKPSSAIAELRRRSGLTWDQLAHLFGVTRRSVHFWASGQALNPVNEERLNRILAVIQYIDRGSAQATRSALMIALNDGVIPLDLLKMGKFGKVKELLGAGPQRSIPSRTPLSVAARALRKPLPPEERVGALHDTIHREVGNYRAAKTGKVKNKQ